MNIDIFRISKSKWTGMGEFNSDDHYIYYMGKNHLEKWSNPHSHQESEMQSQKVCSFPRQTIQYHGNPSLRPDQ